VLEIDGVVAVCEHPFRPFFFDQSVFAWLALLAAGFLAFKAALALVRARRARRVVEVEPWLGSHENLADVELVVLPTAAPLAMAVPGGTNQVLISEGLVDSLDHGTLRAVVEHEAAHLRLRHRRYFLLVTVIDRMLGWVPVIRRSLAVSRLQLEEWADSVAARGCSRRRTELIRAIDACHRLSLHAVLTGTSAAKRRERLQAGGESPSSPARLALHVPTAALVLAAAAAVAFVAGHAQHAITLGWACS
jgi:beta-lactamase regulating signal transducer with metallopeptidase domain